MVDPDGNLPQIVIGAIVGGVVSAAIAAYSGESGEKIAGAFVAGAVGGALAASGLGVLWCAVANAAVNTGEQLYENGGKIKELKGDEIVASGITGALGSVGGKVSKTAVGYVTKKNVTKSSEAVRI